MELDNKREETHPIRRRVFLGRVAKKVAYVAPAVLALRASQTAHGGASACGETGSPCAVDADCCGGFVCEQSGMPCAGMIMCTCI